MKKANLLFLALLITGLSLSAQELISTTFKGMRTKQQLINQFNNPLFQNGVEMYKITYTTPDLTGALDTASGLLVIPVREGSYNYPMLCYQHGTVGSRTDVPSNLQGGFELALVYGAMGYVTAAPDFLGLGEARGFHPYVHAATEASAAIDMLYAVRQYADENDVYLNDQLFITGYSQGGHAAAALHRELEANYSEDFTVTASAPMSGPYSISGEMKNKILSTDAYYFPAYVPYTFLSYNLAYAINYPIEAYFKAPYAGMIEQFYNEEITLGSLNNMLISELTSEFGASVARYMIQDSIIDVAINQPDHPLNLALEDNDVYDWTPQAPTRLYYCTADDQVVYTNSLVADSVMTANGALDLMAIDVNPSADHGECVQPAVTAALFFFLQYQSITVDTDEPVAQQNIKIYPNPGNHRIKLEGVPVGARVTMYDQSGKLQLQGVMTEVGQVNVAKLPAGMYSLHIQWDGGQVSRKVVVK
ncbi:MAG: hypothetical protein DHS20C18_47700 [Saprospiraceae bacterium]|nr:MAG: hypothetical protein DHS20C18_47700 [Saprospiraceae bacterium]